MRKLLLEIISDHGKCPNQKTHESESAGAFPRSEIISKSSFPLKSYIITILKIFGAFWSVFKKGKNGFYTLFSETDLSDVGCYFHI